MTEHTERESHMKADGADENRFAKEETYYVKPEREGLREMLFSFKGRLNRKRYFLRSLLLAFLVVGAALPIEGYEIALLTDDSLWENR